ncbi:unnamed protein product [Spirodela intermedia]|uniref:Uncharacterized protein n=1 Tax=Spirodela intermedia TaxID=51605 RepID=A0ABN7EC16_SPIIN|nr:unnamed protein product [Spirodela intermedia]
MAVGSFTPISSCSPAAAAAPATPPVTWRRSWRRQLTW